MNSKIVSRLLVSFEIISLIFLFSLSFFSLPIADDFIFANTVNKYGWLNSQGYWYNNWLGRYASTAIITTLCSVLPLSKLYPIFPIATILGHFFAFFLLSDTFLNISTKQKKWIFALSLTFSYFSMMPSLAQGLFWFVGSATYSIANIATIIFFALWNKKEKKTIYITLIFLAFFIIGSNEVIMLFPPTFTVFELLTNPKNKKNWLTTLLFLSFIGIVVAAPGNIVRTNASSSKEAHQILFSSVAASGLLLTLIGCWITNPFLWLSLLFFRKEKLHSAIFENPKKLKIAIIFVVGLLFLSIFIHLWATGVPEPGRNLNITLLVFFALFFLLFETLFLKKITDSFIQKRENLILIALSVFAFIHFMLPAYLVPAEKLSFATYKSAPTKAVEFVWKTYGENNFWFVYHDLFNGDAAKYKDEINLAPLKNNSNKCTSQKPFLQGTFRFFADNFRILSSQF